MENKERVVYLEDVETSTSSQKTEVAETTVAVEKTTTTTTVKTTVKAGVKRQRTLMDTFISKSSTSSNKKLKLAGSSSNVTTFGLQPLNSIPFSLSAFLDSLTEEEKKLLQLECEIMGTSWLKLLKDEIKKPYFIKLKRFLWDEGVRGAGDISKSLKVYPPPRNIYTWSDTPLGRVKVVIFGQDPYHGPRQAHGLCFSVPVGVGIPPSLRNIYAEIKAEYPEFEPPKHGNLTAWANSGVLMLNTCLTVRANQAGSHSNKGWEEFTDKVVDIVDKYGGANLPLKDAPDKMGHGRGVAWLAWGSWAAKRVAKLNKTKHLILMSAHPSPLSAYRGFFGNGHFKSANEWLEERYGAEGRVNWCDLEVPKPAVDS